MYRHRITERGWGSQAEAAAGVGVGSSKRVSTVVRHRKQPELVVAVRRRVPSWGPGSGARSSGGWWSAVGDHPSKPSEVILSFPYIRNNGSRRWTCGAGSAVAPGGNWASAVRREGSFSDCSIGYRRCRLGTGEKRLWKLYIKPPV